MVHSAVLSFTCGSLREVCMEARAVTAGLPALTGGGCRRLSAIRVVHLPWKGFSVGSRAQGVGIMGSRTCRGRTRARTIYLTNPSRTRGSNQFAACSSAWRLKVWRKDPGVPGRSLVCCWCCGGPASKRLGLAHEQLGNVE